MTTLTKKEKPELSTDTSALPPVEETKVDLGKMQEEENKKAKAKEARMEESEVLANPSTLEHTNSPVDSEEKSSPKDPGAVTTSSSPKEEKKVTVESNAGIIANPASEEGPKESAELADKERDVSETDAATVIENVAVKHETEDSAKGSGSGGSELGDTEDEETPITKL